MKIKELYTQLTHDLEAHGDLEFVVEFKDPMGNIVRLNHLYDRYVSVESPQRYVMRMGAFVQPSL